MKKLLYSLLLLVVSVALAVVMLPLGILWTIGEIIARVFSSSVKKSAGSKTLWYLGATFRSIAVGIDQIGNAVCRDMFNRLLIEKEGYKFWKVNETISSVLGKNERDGTLSIGGLLLVILLDSIDKDHCRESIQDFIS